MPQLKFVAKTVDAIGPTAGRRVEYLDTVVRGLALRVTESGAKSWTLRYRHRGRLRRITLGSTEKLGLADARQRARDLLVDVSGGADPATEKIEGRTAETIADLAELYVERWAKPRKRSWRADDGLLRNKVLPKWRHRAIVDITRRDVRDLVDDVAQTAPIVANRVAALLSKLFAFALDRDLVEHSPAVRIPRPGQEQARDRVLTEDELRTFWRACDGLDAPMRAFYRLRLLTAQRGGEVAAMRWQDVDLESGWWTIPSASAKNKLSHHVPLGPAAVAILNDLRPTKVTTDAEDDEDETIDYVLVGARGKRQQSEAARAFASIPDFQAHDLRRTAATLMTSRGGITRFTVGRLLNHVERSITRVYDREFLRRGEAGRDHVVGCRVAVHPEEGQGQARHGAGVPWAGAMRPADAKKRDVAWLKARAARDRARAARDGAGRHRAKEIATTADTLRPTTVSYDEVWLLHSRQLDALLMRCEQAQAAVLARLKIPTEWLDPALLEDLLEDRKKIKATKQLHRLKKPTSTNQRRAEHAMYAILYLNEIRQHVAPGKENALRAALAALQAGILCNDAVFHAEQAAGRPKGGQVRGERISAAAKAQQARATRLFKEWTTSEDIQVEYSTPAKYLVARLRDPFGKPVDQRTAQRLVKKARDSS